SLRTCRNEFTRAIESITEWHVNESATNAAGLGETNPLSRREVTARIDASIDTAPPHLRTSRLAVAARARRVAVMPQCPAIERELATPLTSDLPPDDWLEPVAALATKAGRATQGYPSPLRALSGYLCR